jgi:tetratricopeptide (TPR) repeat protein
MDNSERTSNASNRRLDSWTEIGAFFDRDEPTVRRWAKTRSLPVHRVPGQSGVYAFTDELSQWLKTPAFIEAWSEEAAPPGQQTEPDDIPFQEDAPPPRKLPKSWLLAAGGTAVVVLGLAVFLVVHFRGPSPAAKGANPSACANAEANEFYLKGKYQWTQRTAESLNKAAEDYTQAIVLDTKCAKAFAGLAETHNLLREYTTMPDREAFPKAESEARKALELDDSLADAHRALAFASFYWSWDFAGAEREFKRAIELDPNAAVNHHWYATSLLVLGRSRESLKEIERARELDPSSDSILADKGLILYATRPAEAMALLKQIERARPDFLSPHAYLAGIAMDSKDYPTYLAESKKVAEILKSKPATEIAKAAEKGYNAGGAKGMLENMRQAQEKYFAQGDVSGHDLARTCAMLGRNDEALRYLQAEFDQHDPRIIGIWNDSAMNGLHGDPAFQNLLARIGIPPL